MLISDHAEERLTRVERTRVQCRREAYALKAVAASKVVAIVVEAEPPFGPTRTLQPAKPKQSK